MPHTVQGRWLLPALLLCSLLQACPQPPPADQNGKEPAAGSSTTAGGAEQQEEAQSGAAAATAPAAEDELPTPPGGRSLPLDTDGLRLDWAYERVREMARANGEPLMRGIWLDHTGGTGVLACMPSRPGQSLPCIDFYFEKGRLVGFFKRTRMSFDDLTVLATQLSTSFEPGRETAPDWAAELAFIRALPKTAGRDVRLFWEDAGRKDLLLVQRLDAGNETLVALFRPLACEPLGLEYAELLECFADDSKTPETTDASH